MVKYFALKTRAKIKQNEILVQNYSSGLISISLLYRRGHSQRFHSLGVADCNAFAHLGSSVVKQSSLENDIEIHHTKDQKAT